MYTSIVNLALNLGYCLQTIHSCWCSFKRFCIKVFVSTDFQPENSTEIVLRNEDYLSVCSCLLVSTAIYEREFEPYGRNLIKGLQ